MIGTFSVGIQVMTLEDVMIIVSLGFIGWFFWRQLAIRELALKHALAVCEQQDLQLLDQSIGLSGMGFKRRPSGSVCLTRRYQFEFTRTGERRYSGRIVMAGLTVIATELDAFRE